MTDPSDPSTTGRGPVSAAIEQEVLGELRRQGIVVWLDKDGHYTRLVDDLAAEQARGEFPFPAVAVRGSFLDIGPFLDQGARVRIV
ncbi:hypothetical protein [Sorangium sp. So ce385]|uniref:hypothetical protein n=1 Tax=Sorangium sp. So ce385 TaxID=3133308 RepID=UPI003F5B36E1